MDEIKINTEVTVTPVGQDVPLYFSPEGEFMFKRKIAFEYTTTLPVDKPPIAGLPRIYYDGVDYWLYVYINSAWRSQKLGITTSLPSGTQGDILYYNGSAWVVLAAGTSGYLLKTLGASANPAWTPPTATDLSVSGQAQGDVLYFNGSNWVRLAAGTSGYFLKTLGASANPIWAASTASDLSISGQAQGDILYFNGTNWVRLAAGTAGSLLQTQGAAANPTWQPFVKFGGDGTDGALSIASGTTTIDCANAQLVVKQYTSIAITGTGVLAFSNPATLGTTVILKSQGAVTLTSSATPMIAMNSMGAAVGTGGGSGGTGNGSGGAGGASQGTNGDAGDNQINGGSPGTTGSSGVGLGKNIGGTGGVTNVSAAGGVAAGYPSTFGSNFRAILVVPGSGGGGGAGGKDSAGADGGLGGGALYIECNGAFNFTTTSGISVAGGNGGSTSAGGNKGGNGGGGGAGTCLILYSTLTANTGTVTVAGGAAGTGPSGGAGGAGGTGYAIIAQNTFYT